ncbi:MAG: hypothetical protein J0L62_14660 [Bacteroidetes bacterium]|nr:hypothetical protein [Bacteroidota bacterium]
MAGKSKEIKPAFDHDLWEKLFSALVVIGVLMVITMLIKFSLEELSFEDVLIRTGTISFLIIFHMSSASIGGFFMIIVVYLIGYRHLKFSAVMTPSLLNYAFLFAFLLVSSMIYDAFHGWQFADFQLFGLSFGLGILTSLIILLIGRFLGPKQKG